MPSNDTRRRGGILAMTLAASLPAGALAAGNSYSTWADVTQVQPVFVEQVVHTPVERCTTYRSAERVRRDPYIRYEDEHGSPLRALVGGVIGGLIGNQFGGGNGKRALTVAGALAGASIANHAGRRSPSRHHDGPVKRCEIEYEREVHEELLGYDVTYRYQGHEFTKRTNAHPGDQVRIRVSVTPQP